MKEYGYDRDFYLKIENQEYENTKYRRAEKVSYSFKYGREALMELYGWLMMHLKVQNEYIGTFRSHLITIDPSSPKFPTKKSLVTDYLLPVNLSILAKWMNESLSAYIKSLTLHHLPCRNDDWVLLRAYCSQKDSTAYANIYFSVTSQLVPKNMKLSDAQNIDPYDEADYSHAFASELGWKLLRITEDYDNDEISKILLSRYSFSSWSQDRFDYTSFTCLNPQIAKEIGLSFDIPKMTYFKGEEEVSAYYVNDTDLFFYLRKDIVDEILSLTGSKIRHHIYERRMVDEKLPANAPNVKNRYVQYEEDCFYGETKDF